LQTNEVMTIQSNDNDDDKDNVDDNDKMDLVLNSDFDASLLEDCWASNAPGKQDSKGSSSSSSGGENAMSQSPRSNHSGGGGGVSWDSHGATEFARLPNFPTEADEKSRGNTPVPPVGMDSNASAPNMNVHLNHPWQVIQQKGQQLHSSTPSPMPQSEGTSGMTNNNEARTVQPVSVSTNASVTSTITKDGNSTARGISYPN
jgi:hypothetical protein